MRTTCITGTVPDGTGGAIADGTYVLTEIDAYACGPAGGPPPGSQTVIISGGCMQVVAHSEGTAVSASATFVVSGNQIRIAQTCIAAGGQSTQPQVTFTATESSMTLFYPLPYSRIQIYERR